MLLLLLMVMWKWMGVWLVLRGRTYGLVMSKSVVVRVAKRHPAHMRLGRMVVSVMALLCTGIDHRASVAAGRKKGRGGGHVGIWSNQGWCGGSRKWKADI
jgi:hypothetical protein